MLPRAGHGLRRGDHDVVGSPRPDAELPAEKVHIEHPIGREEAVLVADRRLDVDPCLHGEGALEIDRRGRVGVAARQSQDGGSSGSEFVPDLLDGGIVAQNGTHVGHDGDGQARGLDVAGGDGGGECCRSLAMPGKRRRGQLPLRQVEVGHQRREFAAGVRISRLGPSGEGVGPGRPILARRLEQLPAGVAGHRADLAKTADCGPAEFGARRSVERDGRCLRSEARDRKTARHPQAEQAIGRRAARREQRGRRPGHDRLDRSRVEARAQGKQRVERARLRLGIDREPLEGRRHVREPGLPGEETNLLGVGRPAEIGEQPNESSRRCLGLEREHRKQAILHGQAATCRRIEKCGDLGGMLLHRPAGEEPLELPVIGRPRIALRGAAGKPHEQRDRFGRRDGDAAKSVAQRGPHPRRRVVDEQTSEAAKLGLGAGDGRDPDRLVPQVGRGIGDQLLEQGHGDGAEPFEGPESSRAATGRGRRISRHALEFGNQRSRVSVDDFLPGEVGEPGVRRAEVPGQVLRSHRCDRHRLADRLRRVPDPPDPAADAIAVGMRPRHLVVGDDLVVPVDDIQAAVGAKLESDRAERRIAALEQVVALAIRPVITGPCGDDRLDRVGDRIGDVEDPLVGG